VAKTGLQEFRDLLSDYKSVSSITIGGAVAAPLADIALRVGPPWPTGVPFITATCELLALVYVFHFWFRKSRKRIRKRMIAFLALSAVALVSYLVLSSSYTFVSPATSNRYVKGFVLRSDVQSVITNAFTEDDALAGAEYDAKEVWKPWSITAMEIIILATWLLLFTSISIFIGAFVMVQRLRIIKK